MIVKPVCSMRRAARVAACGLAVAGLAGALMAFSATPAWADSATAPSIAGALGLAAALEPAPATLTASQLDIVVGSYAYRGETHDITARAAIEDAASLAAVANGDGTYAAPTAEMIVTYARNRILATLVEEAGIEVTEDEMTAYAEQNIGVGDIATVAQYYGMEEEQARRIIEESAAVVKLRDQVVGTVGPAPQAPVAPGSQDEAEQATEAYAAYVLDLVGDAWDAEAGTWTDAGAAYRQALGEDGFDGVTATYATAQLAYYVAYTLYQQEVTAQRLAWTTYVNGYLQDATICIATLRS